MYGVMSTLHIRISKTHNILEIFYVYFVDILICIDRYNTMWSRMWHFYFTNSSNTVYKCFIFHLLMSIPIHRFRADNLPQNISTKKQYSYLYTLHDSICILSKEHNDKRSQAILKAQKSLKKIMHETNKIISQSI